MKGLTLPVIAVALLLLSPPAHAGKGFGQFLGPPASAKPASNVFITTRTRFMKNIVLTVDGMTQGRRYPGNARSGQNQDVVWYVRFPQKAVNGRWEVVLTGEDDDGNKLAPVKIFVRPTKDRDIINDHLEIRDYPLSVKAPATSELKVINEKTGEKEKGKPRITFKIRTYGIHQVRFNSAELSLVNNQIQHVDPNTRPTTKVPLLVAPADKGKMAKVTIEGLDETGKVLVKEERFIKIN